MSCRLIINVDDFGWSEGVNEAVCVLHDEGIVTSTSLMVGCPAVEDAVERARRRPKLAVGLHMTLVYGPAVLPRERLPHLVDDRGWFTMNPTQAAVRYTFLRSCHPEIRAELEAQFAAFAKTGLPWSHLDSHLHFALTPVFFLSALKIAQNYPVRAFRMPEDDHALYRGIDPADARKQVFMARHFHQTCLWQRWELKRRGFHTTRWCYGFFRTGRLDTEYLVRLVEQMPDGDLELHCHPDLSTEAGKTEFQALRSPEFRQALERRGVLLATYSSLRE